MTGLHGRRAFGFFAAGAATVCITAGCQLSREEQLQRVARDWCQTIRASQIIPVYPLTEDVQPGDIYLVQTTIDRQQEQYRLNGFLPLDNHLDRLDPTGYVAFYDHSFLIDCPAPPRLPGTWTRPPRPPLNGEPPTPAPKSWEPAPNAAFPSYAFSVTQSGGLNLAVPISGIPIGLSLMGTHTANGSISIERARTLGVDTVSLYANLQRWALQNREFLKAYSVEPGRPPNYLRVITRVYATGKVDVTLADARSVAGGADVGVPRPIDLVNAKAPSALRDTNEATLENYRANLAALNAMLAESGTPTRPSGSNAGLDAASVDAKTRAKQEELERLRAEQADAVKAAANKAKTASEAEARALKELEAARKVVADRRRELDALPPDDDGRGAASAALDEATRQETAKEAAYSDAQTSRAVEDGKTEALRGQLASLSQLAPGGSVRVTAAASRFIALQQSFDPPLVIGYLGFDAEIRADGMIGPPIPTHARLDPSQGAVTRNDKAIVAFLASGLRPGDFRRLEEAALQGDADATESVRRLNALATNLPSGEFRCYRIAADGTLAYKPASYVDRNYLDVHDHIGNLQQNIDLLDRALRRGAGFVLTGPGANAAPETIAPGSAQWESLEKQVDRWRDEHQRLQAADREAATAAGPALVSLLIKDLERPPTRQ